MTTEKTYRFNLYNLLTNSRYRIFRHIFLILAMLIISLNQMNSFYDEHSVQLHYKFLCAFALTISYLAAVYTNLYLLVPKFLFTKKYFKYILGIILSCTILIIILDSIEYITGQLNSTISEYSIFNPSNSIFIDFIFTFSLLIVCVTGISATSLLRQWRIENKNILQLKNDYLQTEIEQVKERISPDFLFKILNKAGILSIEEPEQSSRMLVKLSHILRYQLYDCSRDTVLLNSEITFIRNYLNLYRSYNNSFDYNIITSGDSGSIFIPPLLFIPLIQMVLNKSADKVSLYIDFIITDNITGFICSVDTEHFNKIEDSDLFDIHRRLKYLYKDSVEFVCNDRLVVLQITNALNSKNISQTSD